MTIFVAVFAVAMYFLDIRAGIAATVFAVIYSGVAYFLYFHDRGRVIKDLISFATQYGTIQKQLLRDLEIPYALLDESGKIIWKNSAFEQVMDLPGKSGKNITSLIPEITKEKLPRMEHETESVVSVNGRDFRASMNKVSMEALMEAPDAVETVDYDSYLIALYMFDVTEVNSLARQIEEEKRTFEVKTFINDLYNKITKTTQSYNEYKKERISKKDASK